MSEQRKIILILESSEFLDERRTPGRRRLREGERRLRVQKRRERLHRRLPLHAAHARACAKAKLSSVHEQMRVTGCPHATAGLPESQQRQGQAVLEQQMWRPQG